MGCGASTPGEPRAEDASPVAPPEVTSENSKSGEAAPNYGFRVVHPEDGNTQAAKKERRRSSVDLVDSEEVRSLLGAVLEGDAARVKTLLAEGKVDLGQARDAENNSAIMLASEGEHEVLKVLLETPNAPLELKNSKGQTALMLAISYEDATSVEILKTAGAEVSDEAIALARSGAVPEIVSAVTGEEVQEAVPSGKRKSRGRSMDRHHSTSLEAGQTDIGAYTESFKKENSNMPGQRDEGAAAAAMEAAETAVEAAASAEVEAA